MKNIGKVGDGTRPRLLTVVIVAVAREGEGDRNCEMFHHWIAIK